MPRPRPRSRPHPNAIFSLIACNKLAESVIDHIGNEHLISIAKPGIPAIDIGHTRSISGDATVLATLGRNGDVIVQHSNISRIQCTFEIDPDTKAILFYDRSHSQSSQVFGENATQFEHGRCRKVVVQKGLNTIIGMGGAGRDLIQFELEWHHDPPEAQERAWSRQTATLENNPRFAKTVDEAATALPTPRETRIHTPGAPRTVRYIKELEIGTGQFSTVYKALDLDTAKFMAVKIMKRRPIREWEKLKREVEILAKLSHVCIRASQNLKQHI